jgi:acyl dehydratase
VSHFAILTGDPAPPFISENHARENGLPGQLSPGLLGVSLAVGLMWQSGFITDALYMGTERLKLLSPLFAGDRIGVEAEVLAKRQTGKGNWVCSYRWTVKNQNGEAAIEGENT